MDRTPGSHRRNPHEANDEKLARVVDELTERLFEGERLDWPTCLKEHPGEADALKELAPAIEILVMFGKEGSSPDLDPGERPA